MIRAARAACALMVLWVVAAAPRVRAEPAPAEPVALLPLEAERSLELYGQPVASEIARALIAAGVPVVVVAKKAAVPERARLVIEGTLAYGKAKSVAISLRIRRPGGGGVIDTMSAIAPGLAKLDVAAAELSVRLLPIVKANGSAAPVVDPVVPPGALEPARPAPSPAPIALIAVHDDSRTSGGAALAGVLDDAATRWLFAHHRVPRMLDAAKLAPALAAKSVSDAGAELAIGFWVLGYTPEPGKLPMARARVRVRIADRGAVVFDRVVATDTVLGDVGLPARELAERVAREVIAILHPHLARSVAAW